MDFSNLPARAEGGAYHVVVESPRGSALKLKHNPALGVITLSRPLPRGLAYPYDWGFVAGTRAEDGDPLDALIVWDLASYPGVVLPCRPVALVRLSQRKKRGRGRERNDRVIFVPSLSERDANRRELGDLSRRERQEISQFFLSTVFFTQKEARILGWRGAREARRAIEACILPGPR